MGYSSCGNHKPVVRYNSGAMPPSKRIFCTDSLDHISHIALDNVADMRTVCTSAGAAFHRDGSACDGFHVNSLHSRNPCRDRIAPASTATMVRTAAITRSTAAQVRGMSPWFPRTIAVLAKPQAVSPEGIASFSFPDFYNVIPEDAHIFASHNAQSKE